MGALALTDVTGVGSAATLASVYEFAEARASEAETIGLVGSVLSTDAVVLSPVTETTEPPPEDVFFRRAAIIVLSCTVRFGN